MTKRIAWIIFVCIVAGGVLLAQNIASSIVGHVTDQSGAPIAGAQVQVKNTDTGAVRSTVTAASGDYSVPSVLAGNYEVTITKQGFETFHTVGAQVLSAETRRIDASLNVGSVQQTVDVTAQTTPVTTDSMAIGDSVSQKQLENLPTEIQTIDAFIALTPGVQTTGDATNPQIGGGSHWGSVNFNVNGVSNNDPAQAGGATVQGVGLLVMPPPSAIQELKIQANGMDARYSGKSSVTLVTKAGSNAFHFLGYEYLQNPTFNANTYVNNANGIPRPNNHLNQFGGNIGGPIVKDKLFFFADYSGFRKKLSGTAQQNYPTQAERNGDFSALLPKVQLYNPWTGQPFPNNQIPSSMFAPQSVALLKYLPLPTVTTSPGLPNNGNNFFQSIPIEQNVNGGDARIDYNLRPSDQIYGVFAAHLGTPWNSFANWPSTFGQLRYGYKNYTGSLTETHIFNPMTINDFRVGWADYATKFSGLNQDFNPQSLFPQMPDTLFRGLPQINISGYGNSGVLIHDYGSGNFTPRWDWEFTDNFTHTHGRHTLEMGFDETGYKDEARKGSSQSDPPTGLFAFDGSWTGNKGWPAPAKTSGGNAFADFLLGAIHNDATAWQGNFASAIYSRDWAAYFQDTWQATSSLTLILGVRWEYQQPWRYRQPQTTSFDEKNNKLILSESSATPVLLPNMDAAQFAAYPFETTQSLGLPLYYIKSDMNNFAPRLGFAWRPLGNDTTVIRGGYGIYYNFQPANVGSRLDGQNTPWQLSTAQPFTTARPGKLTTAYLPDYTFANPFGSGTSEVVSPNPTINYLQRDFQNAKIQEWNLSVEHGFAGGWVLRTSYIGNHSDHLPYNGSPINMPIVQQPNVTLQKQRPYQPFGAINETRSLGIENFNQLQAGIRRRFANGFSFQGEYEWTRSLDDVPTSGGPMIVNDPMSDYGNTDGVRRHWFIANYVYQLPFGKGRRWMNGGNGVEDAVLGGWTVSGITTYATGTPFSVNFSQTGTGIVGWWGGRADRVPGVPLYVQQSGHDIINGVQWFNPDAFAPPAKWAWGNSQRNMLFGPGYENWDLSAQKSFALTERLSVKFRADFLDAFNHMNLGNPNASIADTRDNGTANPNSGQITGGSGNRIVQFGLTIQY